MLFLMIFFSPYQMQLLTLGKTHPQVIIIIVS